MDREFQMSASHVIYLCFLKIDQDSHRLWDVSMRVMDACLDGGANAPRYISTDMTRDRSGLYYTSDTLTWEDL